MRWILGHEDSEQYWFVDNKTVRRYLNGDKVEVKCNSIKIEFFREIQPVNKFQLISLILDWSFK